MPGNHSVQGLGASDTFGSVESFASVVDTIVADHSYTATNLNTTMPHDRGYRDGQLDCHKLKVSLQVRTNTLHEDTPVIPCREKQMVGCFVVLERKEVEGQCQGIQSNPFQKSLLILY